jgi:hypothetical protein
VIKITVRRRKDLKSQISGVALLGVALLAGQARASIVTINFDDLGPFVTVTNQYPNVTFSAGNGDVVETTPQNPPYTGSPANLICTFYAGTIDCAADITLTFATPVDNLTFDAFGNQTAVGLRFAVADVYQGGVTPTSQNLTVSHTQAQDIAANCAIIDCLADPQTLNFTGITKVVIRNNTDPNGTAYDNFSFDPPDPTAPEPSTLLLTGLCGLVWTGRRFLTRKSR